MAEPETFALIHCNVLFHVCVKKKKNCYFEQCWVYHALFPLQLVTVTKVILF